MKVLAPSSIEEVDQKIAELREREKLFERGCQEEQISENDSKLLEEIKNKKSTGRQVEKKKVEVEEEFPTIWFKLSIKYEISIYYLGYPFSFFT